MRNNFSRASWFIRVLSAHSRTRVWGRDLPVTPVILRNKGFPCITSMIIPSPSSHCLLGRCRLPGHEIEPARVSPGLILIHPVGQNVSWALRDRAGTYGAPIGALPRAEGGLWTPEARLAAARASPCAPNDGLPVGRVTRTLAHAAEHENNNRCGRHIWLQWTMIVGGKARPPQRMFGTVHQASRL